MKVEGKDQNFANLQSQCGFYLADKINESALAIKCEMPGNYKNNIGEELEQLKKVMNDAEGKKKLIGKDFIKQLIGRSPDWRDAYMQQLHEEFPHYGWDKNKGYPTPAHLKALNDIGPSPYHRLTFGPVHQLRFPFP